MSSNMMYLLFKARSRHWKVGRAGAAYKLCDKHTSIAIIEDFEATLDVEMHAGIFFCFLQAFHRAVQP